MIPFFPRWQPTVWRQNFENIVAFGVDTDVSPYDSGSYASATTYATGNAVINACNELKKRIIRLGAEMLGVSPEEADFDGKKVYAGEKRISLQDVAYKGTCGNTLEMQVTASYSSQISPPLIWLEQQRWK